MDRLFWGKDFEEGLQGLKNYFREIIRYRIILASALAPSAMDKMGWSQLLWIRNSWKFLLFIPTFNIITHYQKGVKKGFQKR